MSESNDYCVYSYSKPDAPHPFYLGYATLESANNLFDINRGIRILETIKSLSQRGLQPIIIIHESNMTRDHAHELYNKLYKTVANLIPFNLRPKIKGVESYCLATGATIKQYNHISEITADGYDVPNAIICIYEMRRHHKGIGWRKFDD